MKRKSLSLFLACMVAVAPKASFALSCVPDTISGTVYRDFNYDGMQNQEEPGIKGMIVKAYGADGSEIASAISDSTGGYSLAVSSGQSVRVELEDGADYLFPGAHGAQSSSDVRFVKDSACDIDFALANPVQFCQSEPEVITPRYTFGNPLPGSVPGEADWLVTFPYSRTGQYEYSAGVPKKGADWVAPSHKAKGKEIGTLWGVTHDRTRGVTFASAFLKRGAGFGPLGPGGIYTVNRPSNDVSPWLDLQSVITGSVGADPHTDLTVNGLGSMHDRAAFGLVGKSSLGGIKVSNDGSALFVMNLHDRVLHEISLQNFPTPPTAADIVNHDVVAAATANGVVCTNGEIRPFAVTTHPDSGDVYVGGVCSAEKAGGNTTHLSAFVMKRAATDAPGEFTLVFENSLAYPRHNVLTNAPMLSLRNWLPWVDTQAVMTGGTWPAHPSPMLTAIEFDPRDGTMILGLNDRAGHQLGHFLYSDTIGDKTLYRAITGGDILRVCFDEGRYYLENNGSCPLTGSSLGVGMGAGPGGGEFFWDDMFVRKVTGTLNYHGHGDNTMGGLTVLPSSGEVMVTTNQPSTHQVYDPITKKFVAPDDIGPFYSGGVIRFDTKTGSAGGSATEPRHAYTLYDSDMYGNSTFGKAAGLGDLEVLCDEAPVEIGNRVWIDSNDNGTQDADELGVAGVTVSLYQNSTLVQSVRTAEDGTFYFSVLPETDYELRLDNELDFFADGVLGNYILGKEYATKGSIDSNGVFVGTTPVATVRTGAAGENDFSFDFGFVLDACPTDMDKKDPGVCGCGQADVDLNGDGIIDCTDLCPSDPDKTEPGICGCGTADSDSDGDGILDCQDACPTDGTKDDAGVCGCGVADTDSDGDGIVDCLDLCPTYPDSSNPEECGCRADDESCCTSTEQSETLTSLDQGAKKQEALINQAVRYLKGKLRSTLDSETRSELKGINEEAHKLQLRNWFLSWRFPTTTLTCAGTVLSCSTEDYSAIANEYTEHAGELFKLQKRVTRIAATLMGGAPKKLKKLRRRAKKLRDENLAQLATVPVEQFVCE